MDNIDDSRLSPFGIHSIGRVGLTHGRRPGDWYGPQAICNVLQELNQESREEQDKIWKEFVEETEGIGESTSPSGEEGINTD